MPWILGRVKKFFWKDCAKGIWRSACDLDEGFAYLEESDGAGQELGEDFAEMCVGGVSAGDPNDLGWWAQSIQKGLKIGVFRQYDGTGVAMASHENGRGVFGVTMADVTDGL